jgi:hypothetical protein
MRKPPSFRFLPPGTLVYDVADACRAAALELLSGTNAGWSRAETDTWLEGSYRRASSYMAHLAPLARTSAASEDRQSVADVRESTLAMLLACATSWESATFARELLEGGFVVGVRDDLGSIGYCPVAADAMPLVARVASLIVADYLTRPADYTSLVLCEHCEEVSFAWAPIHSDSCGAERRVESGVVPKHEGRSSLVADILPPWRRGA